MIGKTHALKMSVRDYELDYQGVVNNANYLHYLEHARNTLFNSRESRLNIVKLAQEDINLMVSEINIQYKSPLVSHDDFTVISYISLKTPLRLTFEQEIKRDRDNSIICKALVTVVCVQNSKPLAFEKAFPELFD